MRLNIKKTPDYYSSVLSFFGFFTSDREYAEYMADNFRDTWLSRVIVRHILPLFQKITEDKIIIEPHDTWNADHTLAKIIVPLLTQLKETTHGSPSVDNDDVPEHLHRPAGFDEYETDEHWHERWQYVLEEMIWAFNQMNIGWESQYWSGEHDLKLVEIDEEYEGEKLFEMVEGPDHTFKIDWEGKNKHYARMQNGWRLFGKYYDGLWD